VGVKDLICKNEGTKRLVWKRGVSTSSL